MKDKNEAVVRVFLSTQLTALFSYIQSLRPELTETEVARVAGVIISNIPESINSDEAALNDLKVMIERIISQR